MGTCLKETSDQDRSPENGTTGKAKVRTLTAADFTNLNFGLKCKEGVHSNFQYDDIDMHIFVTDFFN
jgi:hypothetical protein